MNNSIKNILDKTKQIQSNSAKAELVNSVLEKNNITLSIKSIDDLNLNSAKELSSIRISTKHYQRFLQVKEDLKAMGISVSTQEFFDYIISQFFKNP